MKQKLTLALALFLNFLIFNVVFAGGQRTAIEDFSDDLWRWARVAIITISTAIFVLAGVTYMISGGNPKRVDFAKRLITGAVSALLVLFLGEFILKVLLGVEL